MEQLNNKNMKMFSLSLIFTILVYILYLVLWEITLSDAQFSSDTTPFFTMSFIVWVIVLPVVIIIWKRMTPDWKLTQSHLLVYFGLSLTIIGLLGLFILPEFGSLPDRGLANQGGIFPDFGHTIAYGGAFPLIAIFTAWIPPLFAYYFDQERSNLTMPSLIFTVFWALWFLVLVIIDYLEYVMAP